MCSMKLQQKMASNFFPPNCGGSAGHQPISLPVWFENPGLLSPALANILISGLPGSGQSRSVIAPPSPVPASSMLAPKGSVFMKRTRGPNA